MKPLGKIVLTVLALGTAFGLGTYLYRRHQNLGGIGKSILFIGDSNTAMNYSYADQLQKKYPAIRIKKIAKVGEKTDWMLTNLTQELKQNKYDTVAILGGSNDIYALNSNAAAKKNLDAMYKLAHASGAKVLAVTPPNHSFYTKSTPQKISIQNDLDSWILNNANKDYFIDFQKITNDKSFFIKDDGYLHAQAPAHKLLADQTEQLLKLKNG